MGKKTVSTFTLAAVGVVAAVVISQRNLLSGFTENHSLGSLGLQASIAGYCMTGAYKIVGANPTGDDHFDPMAEGVDRNFNSTGEMREDEYTKQSIYSLLYAAYRSTGIVDDVNGRPYRFTFNTWGIAGVDDKPYGPEYPQRHGMTAYHSLATMPAFVEYVKNKPQAQVLEIGCGTGAGADLISRMVHPTIRYTALDMQKAAIETCVKLHAAHDNPHLTCLQGNGKTLPFADNSVDVIVVSETHIAEMEIGPEEIAIFAEMKRVLIPGGIFVWGNALPTKVWHDGAEYLQSVGFEDCGLSNYTQRAVVARDEDLERVNRYVDDMLNVFPVFKVPIVGPDCRHVLDRMIKNFYRHPGTDLYERMVVGADSYMNMCHRLK